METCRSSGCPREITPTFRPHILRNGTRIADSKDPNPDISFTVTSGYSETRARISWIRAAYLAAFAGLGWPYIFRDVVQPIQDQLIRPDREIIPTYTLRSPGVPTDTRRILIVEEPSELRCIAVVMGDLTVFLPGLWEPLTCAEIADAFAQRRGSDSSLQVTFMGKEVPWPRWATYLLG
jgi:hypothetical protein